MRITGSQNTYYQPWATSEDYFFKIFLSDTCKQESCSKGICPFRKELCFSDIRVGDYWGERFSEDRTGVSVVIPNTGRGETALSDFDIKEQSDGFHVADLRVPSDRREQVLSALRNGMPIPDVWILVSKTSLLFVIHQKFCEKQDHKNLGKIRRLEGNYL